MQILYAFTLREGAWIIQIHGSHVPEGKRHVHISRKKIRGKYSWNIDGTRHDKGNFPTNDNSIVTAKRLAAKHLGISQTQLSFLTALSLFEQVEITLESDPATEPPKSAGILALPNFKAKTELVILAGRSGRIHIITISRDNNE